MEFIGQNDGDEKVSSTNKATEEQVFGFSILSDNSLQGIGDSEMIHLPQQVELNDEQIHLNQKNGEEIILLMNASQGDAHGDPRTSHDSEGNTEITTVGNLPVTVNTGAVKMEYGKENGGIYDMLPSELDVLKDGNTDTLSVDVSHVLHSASKQKGLARKVQDDDSGPVHDMSEEAKWKTVTEGFVCSETLKKGKGEHYNNVSDFQGLENAVIENNKCLPKGFHKEESSWKENIPKPGVPMGKRSQLCVTCVNICESDLDQVETEVECKQKDSAKSSDRLHWPVIAKLEREDSSLKQILPTEKLENISYQVLNILDKETVDVQVENCNQGRVVTQVSGPNYVKVSNHKEEYDQAQNFGMGGAQVLTGRDNFNQNTVVAQACASTYSIHTGEDDQQHLLPQIFDSMNNQVSVPKEECDQDGIIGPASDPSNILASTPEDKSDQDIMGTEIISLNGIQLSSYKKECHKEDIVVSASKPNDIQDSTTEKECHKEDIIQVYCSEKQLGEQNSLVQFQNSCTKFDQSSLKTNILSIPELGDMKKAFELQDDDCCFSVKHEPQAAEEMLKTLMENNRDSSIQVAVPYELETNVQKSCREGINDSIGDLSHTYKEFFTKENVLKSYSKKASFESHIIIPKIKGKSEQLVTMCKTPESKDQVEWSDSSETLTDNKSQTAKKRKIQAGSGTCGKQLKIVEATLSDSIKENKEMETMVEMTPRTSRKRNTSNIVGLRTLYLRSSVKKIKKYSESHSSHVKSIPKLYTDQSDKDEMEADQSNISQMKTNLRLEADKQKDTDVQGITDHIVKNKNKSKRNQPSCRESENTCEERRKQTPRLSVHKSNRFTNEIQINKNFSELLEKQWAELTGRRLSHSKTRKKLKKVSSLHLKRTTDRLKSVKRNVKKTEFLKQVVINRNRI
ncbi:uncharacterized protein LOC106475371 [Limulus polyphemus]|uniref:Uncharacterized protein LOC106475371 n=1 Tax=Limulus polyphemus TaxID=6850 RepID=A0ABM1BZB0_LIMPO|nr:uncharacterized protein LOC106475371 [Limulus polyphemus]